MKDFFYSEFYLFTLWVFMCDDLSVVVFEFYARVAIECEDDGLGEFF